MVSFVSLGCSFFYLSIEYVFFCHSVHSLFVSKLCRSFIFLSTANIPCSSQIQVSVLFQCATHLCGPVFVLAYDKI